MLGVALAALFVLPLIPLLLYARASFHVLLKWTLALWGVLFGVMWFLGPELSARLGLYATEDRLAMLVALPWGVIWVVDIALLAAMMTFESLVVFAMDELL